MGILGRLAKAITNGQERALEMQEKIAERAGSAEALEEQRAKARQRADERAGRARAAANSREEKRQEKVRKQFRTAPAPNGEILVFGSEEKKVYVYNSLSIGDIEVGDTFTARLSGVDAVLQSTATGTATDSSGTDLVPLLRDWFPFGFAHLPKRDIARLSKAGYDVDIVCERTGTYLPGIPEIVCRVPDYSSFDSWVDMLFTLDGGMELDMTKAEPCSFTVNEDKVSPHAIGNALCAKLDIVLGNPPAEGKAKPHVFIMHGNDGILELGARSTRYKMLAEHVGESVPALVRRKVNSMDGSVFYSFTLLLRRGDAATGSGDGMGPYS